MSAHKLSVGALNVLHAVWCHPDQCLLPYYHLFSRYLTSSRFKKFREIKVPRINGAAKIKDAKFSDLYQNLYFSFPSARSIHTSRRVQILVQRMPLFLII